MYHLFLVKRWVEDIIMFPLILIGRSIAYFRPQKKTYKAFIFFPFYHIGGAEKVHAQIAQAVGSADSVIYFTRKSGNDLFFQDFEASCCELRDISSYTDNKWIYFVNIIFRGIISGYINRQKIRPVIFNGQCNFGYKLSPWINKSISQIELIHSLCSFSYIRIPYLPFIKSTVMISTVRIQEHLDLYKRYNIPLQFGKRIRFIMNGINLPDKIEREAAPDGLIILYVGRSTAEKRVHLIAQMAKIIKESGRNIQFQFLGDVKDAIPRELHSYCHFWGNQNDPKTVSDIYRDAHILILVSDTEGFPMVIMEAMAHGLAVIATAVGEIPMHIKNNVNGFLIHNFEDSETVIRQGTEYILKLDSDKALLLQMGRVNADYAFDRFGLHRFNEQYQDLFAEHGYNTG